MIKHIVFWKVKGTAEERHAIIEEFRGKIDYLKTIIPQLDNAVIGENYNDGDVFHVCIDSSFENEELLNSYIDNPEHLKVRAWLNENTYDRAVFDYRF